MNGKYFESNALEQSQELGCLQTKRKNHPVGRVQKSNNINGVFELVTLHYVQF